jgi:hypothetical protein
VKILLAAVLLAAGGTASAQEPPAATALPAPVRLVLREGTPIAMATREPLSSKSAVQGQRVPLEVTEDVIVDGHVVIPRGTPAIGEVARVVHRGRFGKAGKLEVRAMFVELGGRRIRLEGRTGEHGKSGTAPVAAGVLLIGASASLITGKSALLPAGSSLSSSVYQDVMLEVAPAPVA